MILRSLFLGLCPLLIGAYLIPYSRYLAAHPVEGYVVHPDGIPVVTLCAVQGILLAVASILLVNMGVWDSWLSIRPLQWLLALAGVLAVELVTAYTFVVSMDVQMVNSSRWTLAAAGLVMPALVVAAWAIHSRNLFLAGVFCAFAGFVVTANAEKRAESEGLEQRLTSEHTRIMKDIDQQSEAKLLIRYTKKNVYGADVSAKATAKIESFPDMAEQLTGMFNGGRAIGDEGRLALAFLAERLDRLSPDIQEKCWVEAAGVAEDMLNDVKVYGSTSGDFAISFVETLKLLSAQSPAQRQKHRSELRAAREALRGPFGGAYPVPETAWLDAYLAE